MISYICIGTNCERERNLSFAVNELTRRIPGISFSPAEETEPIGMSRQEWFTNQVGCFNTSLSKEELKSFFKEIENASGRTPEDKQHEIICLDIDLLTYGDEILKPADMERDYVRRGIEYLKEKHKKNYDMKFLGIIPARYASTRFPGKPLAMLGGKPMIQRVYEQVKTILDDVCVATDDERIFKAVEAFGGKVVMTAETHKSGTDRCYEAATKIGGDFDVVINIQGDEPFIQPEQIETVKACFNDPKTHIATLVKPFEKDAPLELLENPNSPKVVVDNNWHALYFSRSVIPYMRGKERTEWLKNHDYYKHIGLYAYRLNVLKEITSLPQSELEKTESLEQLRWLENGYTIKVGTCHTETIGIDTPEDLARAEEFLNQRYNG